MSSVTSYISWISPVISPAISTFIKEGEIVRDYFTESATVKAAMKALQCLVANLRAYTGGQELGIVDLWTRGVETLFDFGETFNRLVKFLTEKSFFSVLDLGVCAVSTIRGFTRCDESKWGLRTVSKIEYNYWTLAKMATSAAWKGYILFSKRNQKMDPFRCARDIFIVFMLTQCAVNAFFNCFRETDKAKLAEWNEKKAETQWKGGGLNGIGRLLFYAEPIDPIKHNAHWMIRALAPIEKIFCNSLLRRYVGVGITATAFIAHRNKYTAAAAA